MISLSTSLLLWLCLILIWVYCLAVVSPGFVGVCSCGSRKRGILCSTTTTIRCLHRLSTTHLSINTRNRSSNHSNSRGILPRDPQPVRNPSHSNSNNNTKCNSQAHPRPEDTLRMWAKSKMFVSLSCFRKRKYHTLHSSTYMPSLLCPTYILEVDKNML